jgi:anti-sigma B factor antagonist
MNLPTEVFGKVVVVHAPEALGAERDDGLAAYVSSLGRPSVVLDLDATESFDSRGLVTLLDLQDQLRGAGGDAKLATTNPVHRKVLEITRLDQQLDVFDSVVDAVKSFH